MLSSVLATFSDASRSASQLISSVVQTEQADKPAKKGIGEAKNAGSEGVIIELSVQAQTLLTSQNAPSKSFGEVTEDARSTIDAGYAEMKAAGKPFDFAHATDADWDRVFGSLDRRSLYAVASNSGGKFSEDEQKIAQSIMSEQQGIAMGLYQAPPLSFTDPAASFAGGIAFMDGVSAEEKASPQWMYQRAALQWSYEETSKQAGTPDHLDSGNPVVRMLVKTLRSLKNRPPRSTNMPTYIKDFKDLPFFDIGNFAGELRDAMQQLQKAQVQP
jgi:hypothetical protein